MSDEIKFIRKQRTALLTDEVWEEIQRQAVLEGKSASDLCGYVLEAYLQAEPKPVYDMPWDNLLAEDRPARFRVAVRSFYIANPLWSEVRALKTRQHRSISRILEQELRRYLLLEVGERQDQIGREGLDD